MSDPLTPVQRLTAASAHVKTALDALLTRAEAHAAEHLAAGEEAMAVHDDPHLAAHTVSLENLVMALDAWLPSPA